MVNGWPCLRAGAGAAGRTGGLGASARARPLAHRTGGRTAYGEAAVTSGAKIILYFAVSASHKNNYNIHPVHAPNSIDHS